MPASRAACRMLGAAARMGRARIWREERCGRLKVCSILSGPMLLVGVDGLGFVLFRLHRDSFVGKRQRGVPFHRSARAILRTYRAAGRDSTPHTPAPR